jgi:hypothetical protein
VRIFFLAALAAGLCLGQNDPVARLIDQLARGEARLEYSGSPMGYLPSILKQLDLNVDSQALVFARNSFQADRISQSNPRAIYFNDDVSVGYIPGGDLIEFAALDPVKGVVFYTLNARQTAAPHFDGCNTSCHGMNDTAVLLVQSGNRMTDHRTPMAERWGGWYVTGSHGSRPHRGTAPEGRFDPGKYPLPTSDIVALMTLEHQTRMTTLMMGVNRQARAVAAGKMNPEWLDTAADQMVTYMLFANEAPLEAPVTGASTFVKTFPERAPRDRQGRSLRDFDLKTRLFRYPLSYMIYSEMFDGMEPAGRERVYRYLYEVLTGGNTDPKFARISAEDRRAVLEIVRDTKSDLPEYWRKP